MMDNDGFSNESNSQFVLSYELLSLFRWLVTHDAEQLKKIIGHALASGLHTEINNIDRIEHLPELEDVQLNIVDFFGMLEELLVESLDEHIEQKAREQNLIPAIDHIDSTVCDDETIRNSLEKTTSKMKLNPQANPKKTLFEELLKQWKPDNKNIIN